MAGKKTIVGETVSTATARFQPIPARKARYVAGLVRGLTVGQAQTTLSLVHRPSAAPIINRLIKSAAANSGRGNAEQLVVGRIQVGDGPMLKRWRPRAFGRAVRIRKRMCHITIELTEGVGQGQEA